MTVAYLDKTHSQKQTEEWEDYITIQGSDLVLVSWQLCLDSDCKLAFVFVQPSPSKCSLEEKLFGSDAS